MVSVNYNGKDPIRVYREASELLFGNEGLVVTGPGRLEEVKPGCSSEIRTYLTYAADIIRLGIEDMLFKVDFFGNALIPLVVEVEMHRRESGYSGRLSIDKFGVPLNRAKLELGRGILMIRGEIAQESLEANIESPLRKLERAIKHEAHTERLDEVKKRARALRTSYEEAKKRLREAKTLGVSYLIGN